MDQPFNAPRERLLDGERLDPQHVLRLPRGARTDSDYHRLVEALGVKAVRWPTRISADYVLELGAMAAERFGTDDGDPFDAFAIQLGGPGPIGADVDSNAVHDVHRHVADLYTQGWDEQIPTGKATADNVAFRHWIRRRLMPWARTRFGDEYNDVLCAARLAASSIWHELWAKALAHLESAHRFCRTQGELQLYEQWSEAIRIYPNGFCLLPPAHDPLLRPIFRRYLSDKARTDWLTAVHEGHRLPASVIRELSGWAGFLARAINARRSDERLRHRSNECPPSRRQARDRTPSWLTELLKLEHEHVWRATGDAFDLDGWLPKVLPTQRAAHMIAYIDAGLSYAEAGRESGKSASTIRTAVKLAEQQVHGLLPALKERLEPQSW